MHYHEPADAERAWIQAQLAAARELTGSPGDTLPSLAELDRAFAEGLTGSVEEVNAVINAIGIAFGEHLVQRSAFEWVIATGEYGTDLAILAFPGAGDVTVFPANFVAKRWESGQTFFLEARFHSILSTLADVERLNRPSARRDKKWWQFW